MIKRVILDELRFSLCPRDLYGVASSPHTVAHQCHYMEVNIVQINQNKSLYQLWSLYYCMTVRLGLLLYNWRHNLMDATSECCERLWGCTGLNMSPMRTSIRTCPRWVKRSGTAREEMKSSSWTSYYGNLVMDSNREDSENSIMYTAYHWTQVFKWRSYKEQCWTEQYGVPP